MKPLNIIFAGTPEFAATHLQALLEKTNHNIIAVYTREDKAAGRGKKIMQSPVKELALEHNIPVYQPKTLRNLEAQEEFKALNADLMVVVAYGLILPKEVLDAPRYGCINVHGSILPRWRGAAPIQRAVFAGDKESGVTIMQMDEGMDTGDMLHFAKCDIASDETSYSLYNKLAQIAPDALIEVVNRLQSNPFEPIKQDDNLATHAAKLTKEEAKLDFNMEAVAIERLIRAYIPSPMAFLEIMVNDKLERIKIHKAKVVEITKDAKIGEVVEVSKEGIVINTMKQGLMLTEIQPSGKKAMKVCDFLNGRSDWFKIGDIV